MFENSEQKECTNIFFESKLAVGPVGQKLHLPLVFNSVFSCVFI